MKVPYNWALILGSTRAPKKGSDEVEYSLRAGQSFCFEGKMNYKAWLPNFMLLYANFIDYTSIGGVQAPVMKMIPLFHDDLEDTDYRGYEPKNTEYHKISYSQLESLRFELRSIDGRLIKFDSPRSKIILSLKFLRQ